MFLAVYSDGNFVKRKTLDEIISLPGNFHIVCFGHVEKLNVENGVKIINMKGDKIDFKINGYEVLEFDKKSTYNNYTITVYNQHRDKTNNFSLDAYEIENAIARLIHILYRASDFKYFEDCINIFVGEKLKGIIEKLNKEIEELKKRVK
jgi:hypothetical protein